jgi:hypothetical protein
MRRQDLVRRLVPLAAVAAGLIILVVAIGLSLGGSSSHGPQNATSPTPATQIQGSVTAGVRRLGKHTWAFTYVVHNTGTVPTIRVPAQLRTIKSLSHLGTAEVAVLRQRRVWPEICRHLDLLVHRHHERDRAQTKTDGALCFPGKHRQDGYSAVRALVRLGGTEVWTHRRACSESTQGEPPVWWLSRTRGAGSIRNRSTRTSMVLQS